MKTLSNKIIIVLLIAVVADLSAEISVKSFRKLGDDMDARIYYSKKDQNGDICAIIKVITTQTGFSWDPDGLGIIEAIPKVGEYWLYVPYGAKRLSIHHSQLGTLRDYMYPIPIEKACVYELVLTTGKVITSVEETIENQWLLISPEPKDAMIYLNDQFVVSGFYQAKVKPGTYTYRVEAPMYHTEAGKLEITDSKKELNVVLKPAFGFVYITSQPEDGAKIIIDDKVIGGSTPCQSDVLKSGTHTLKVIKDGYEPNISNIHVSDGKITQYSVQLIPVFGTLQIKSLPDARIYINNQQKGVGSWNGRLVAGVYSLEARIDKFKPARKEIELSNAEEKVIDLTPTPMYGAIDIMTNPPGAMIYINNEFKTTSPNTIKNLLVGEYELLITKPGYKQIKKNISITYGKSTELTENLNFLDISEDSVVVEVDTVDNSSEISIIENKILENPADLNLWGRYLSIQKNKNNDEITVNEFNIFISKLIQKYPQSPQFYYLKSKVYQYWGKYEIALADSKKAIQLISENFDKNAASEIYYQYATLNYISGYKSAAFMVFEQGLSYNPENTDILNDYAYYLAVDQKRLERASVMSKKAISLDPENPHYLDTYAWICYLQSYYKKALPYITKAIDKIKDKNRSGLLYDHYGDILWFNDYYDMAVLMWKKSVSSGYTNSVLQEKIKQRKWIANN